MPYIGRDLSQGNYLKLDSIESQFNGSKVSFALTAGGSAFFPGSSMALLVSVAGVIQEAESAFTIDQSNIEFASAPNAGDDCFIVVLGSSIGVSVPADGSVTMAKLAQSGIDRLSSVGIQSGGTTIGTGVTFINFSQSGLTATVSSGIATVNLGGKTDEEIQDIVGAMFSAKPKAYSKGKAVTTERTYNVSSPSVARAVSVRTCSSRSRRAPPVARQCARRVRRAARARPRASRRASRRRPPLPAT